MRLPDEEIVINCLGCDRELYRGDEPPSGGWWLNWRPGPFCGNCDADQQAKEEWEASLEERYLKDLWETFIDSQEELRRAGQL